MRRTREQKRQQIIDLASHAVRELKEAERLLADRGWKSQTADPIADLLFSLTIREEEE